MDIDRSRETVLILRTCKADRTSRNGFQWPEMGYVEAPDWNPSAQCGNGLHGWLRGEGDGSLVYDGERLGQVVETYLDHIVDLDGKVKFPFGWVVFTGDLHEAARIVSTKYPMAKVCFGTATAGYRGTATAGYRGTATAGYYGTATAGDGGIIMIQRWNRKRWKYEISEVGEDGLKPNTAYRLDENGNFVGSARA